jgi:site-specific DNA recombinase
MKELFRSLLIVWGYCRTSGKVNGEESIPKQKMLLKEFADKEGYNIRGFIEDEAKSAYKNIRREGYEELVRLINTDQVNCVLVTFFNRLARRAEDLLKILLLMKSKNIECISVTQNKRLSRMSSYEIAFEALMTEEEDKSITRRIHSSKEISLYKGEYLNKPALGYTRNEKRRLIIVPEEAKIVKDIFNEYLAGKPTKEIAKRLNESKVANRNWSSHSVEVLLTNPIYTGKIYRRKEEEDYTVNYELLSPVEHEAIINEEIFFKVAEEINERKRKKGKRTYKKHHHLFKGVLCCPICNKKMRASLLYYTCSNENCIFTSIRKDKIETRLLEFVKSLDRRPDNINSLRQKVRKYTMQLNKLQSDMDKLKQQFAINQINEYTFKEGMFRIGQEIKALQDKIDYGVFQEVDATYSELIDHHKFKELTELMIKRKLTLTFLEEGNTYKIKKL